MLNITAIGDTPASALEAAAKDAPYLQRLLNRADGCGFDEALLAVQALNPQDGLDAVMQALRRAKSAMHLALAGEDLSGQRDVMSVTDALTRFSCAALEAAMAAALAARELDGAGLFAIALGKMGAFELNYSSDIDFCLFFDPDVFDGGAKSPGEAAQYIARDIVRMLSELTADGYVFRTDLRLRPDPSSTPLAVSTRMAQGYYESVGQNWERMVWIKARPAAGDMDAAARFMEVMQPFVWRRHLDYWALNDIQAIKRMINTKSGRGGLSTVSPNVKLGPGGIREVEFFVQTQQLIQGGRLAELRGNTTLGAMDALVAADIVPPKVSQQMKDAYRALRHVEHRIQMLHDEQSHTVPEDDEARASLARLCGYEVLDAFDVDLQATRRVVQEAYDDLFRLDASETDAYGLGNLVFTGVDDDPGTVETLSELGFSDPAAAIKTIRNWHRGNVPATRSTRGRELLTALLPGMLHAMSETGEPDEAFGWFTKFFDGLSSGVQTLSMLLAEPDVLDDLVATLALAPRLASILARRPDLLEILVSGQAPQTPDIDDETDFETALDEWRRYHREQSFLIGHRLLHGFLKAADAAVQWSQLADESIYEMARATEAESVRKSGPAPGVWAVFAMGKLGGREMTAGSDLDLIVIYDAPELDAQVWFTRFTQRLITALSAPTAEGDLYEVDMRLRPSGSAGPVAVRLRSFEVYHNEDAWTWEHMALTRLRFVAGDAALGKDALKIARAAMAARSSKGVEQVAIDVAHMRARLYEHKPGHGLWDLKTAEGGLIDIEFAAQKQMLLACDDQVIRANTFRAIDSVGAAASTDADDWRVLSDALVFLQSLQQVQRVAMGADMVVDHLPKALKNRLCRAVGVADFAVLEQRLREVKAGAHEISARKLQV